MELNIIGNKVLISGNIKSINDFNVIKQSIDQMIYKHKSIYIDIIDSMSITSSVIGYINKIIHKDKIDVNILIHDKNLLRLFDDLNLTQTFKVKSNI